MIKHLEVKTLESLAWRQNMYDVTYDLSIIAGGGWQELYNGLDTHTTGHWTNWSGISDPVYDAMIHDLSITTDSLERLAKVKAAAVYMIERIPAISLNQIAGGHFWWPWIKNYYGERNTGENNFHQILAHAWLDEDMKEDMGYYRHYRQTFGNCRYRISCQKQKEGWG